MVIIYTYGWKFSRCGSSATQKRSRYIVRQIAGLFVLHVGCPNSLLWPVTCTRYRMNLKDIVSCAAAGSPRTARKPLEFVPQSPVRAQREIYYKCNCVSYRVGTTMRPRVRGASGLPLNRVVSAAGTADISLNICAFAPVNIRFVLSVYISSASPFLLCCLVSSVDIFDFFLFSAVVMTMPPSARSSFKVPASAASLATVSPIWDAMKQLKVNPNVCSSLLSLNVLVRASIFIPSHRRPNCVWEFKNSEYSSRSRPRDAEKFPGKRIYGYRRISRSKTGSRKTL
jgi:hypothetical protein